MIGIDISDKSIKVAEVTEDMTPRLRAVGWAALPAEVLQNGYIRDSQTVERILADALARATPQPITHTRVVASIPEIQSFVSVIEVPRMSGREMDEAVQWASQQHLPFDLDRVYLDWQPLMVTPTGKVQVLVGASRRDVVDPLLEVLDALGLTTLSLELEAQSLVRSLLPLDSQGIEGVLIVDIGAVSTNVVYFDRGAMRFSTMLEGGDMLTIQLAQALGITAEEAAEKKALVGVSVTAPDQTVAQPLRAATRALVDRVGQVARDAVRQVSGSGLRAVLLGGGAANLPGIAEVFAEVLPDVPVQLGNPWTNLLPAGREGEAPLSREDAAHFATALGLALRRPELEYLD